MNLEEVKKNYLDKSQEIYKSTKELAKDSYGMREILTNKKQRKAKEKLEIYYSWLNDIDSEYSKQFEIMGSVAEMQMRNGHLSVAERARNIFISSLSGYENAIANIEASTNFKITTILAMFAILVSIFGAIF